MGKPPIAIELTAAERGELEGLASRRRTAQGLARRARIVLAAAEGVENQVIARTLGADENTVGKWRRRFAEHRIDGLHDEPRPGAPRQIGDAEIAETIRLTLETTPPDATHWSLRSMAAAVGHAPSTTGIVGYNVQTAVDVEHHLIVAHEVTNVGHDRTQLVPIALRAQEATGNKEITVLADRGYFNGDQVLACENTGVLPCVPKTLTSSSAKRGLFTRQDFVSDAEKDHYTCPAGQHLTRGRVRSDRRQDVDNYRHLTACFTCPLKSRCTPDKLKRVKRWEHEDVLDAMQARLDQMPDAMLVRRQTVEHPFGTIKAWMGSTHFLTRTLKRVSTEMSLHVLAYNIKRAIAIIGVGPLMQAIRA